VKKITVGVWAATAVALIGYDLIAYVEPTDGDTLSEVVQDSAFNWAAIPFGLGAMLGHWLWPTSKERKPGLKWSGFAGLVAIFGAMFFVPGDSAPPLLFAAAGAVAGRFFWPLRRPSPTQKP
jgi:hypothetical protein